MVTDFENAVAALTRAEVKFIVIGGVAGVLHGSAFLTQDLDGVYSRSRENAQRLVQALATHQPYLREAPPGLPFQWDERTIRNGLNFKLITDFGDLDLPGEVVGGGNYEQLLPHSLAVNGFGLRFRVGEPRPLACAQAGGGPAQRSRGGGGTPGDSRTNPPRAMTPRRARVTPRSPSPAAAG